MFTLPISSPAASLESAGGKGASLARLTRIGLPVPSGFILTTDAYRHFVTTNGLGGVISTCLMDIGTDSMQQLDGAAARCRAS